MLCKVGFDKDQVAHFFLLRCMCTVWWQRALLPTLNLAAPAEDTAAQAGGGRVGCGGEKEPLQCTPDLMFLRDLGALTLASEMPWAWTVNFDVTFNVQHSLKITQTHCVSFSGFPGHPSDSLQGYVLAGPVWIDAPDLRWHV